MSLWDYLLPWKAIPKMADEVEDAWKGKGKNRHDSFLGAIGKYADPGGALLGDKWMNFAHGTIPREVNRALEPVGKFHRDNLDPIYMLGGKDTDWGKAITDQAVNKGGDWSAIITGAVLGGGALAGGGAGGAGSSGGAASGAGSAGGGFQAPWYQNWGAMDWSDPTTYMNLYQQYGSMMPQQQQQQQPPPVQQQGLLSSDIGDEERRRRAQMLASYGYNTYGLLG